METVKCGYEHCTNTYPPRLGKKYCSGSCRAKASTLRQATLGALQPQVKTQDIASHSHSPRYTPQQDPASQYIISHLTEEKKRWEQAYKDEKEKREKLKEKNEELEKKILNLENEQRIAAIENSKPSALNGILENQQLMSAIAPVLQKLLEPGPSAQMTGTNGQQTPAAMFEGWFKALSMDTQQVVWKMLQSFALMPDGDLKEYAGQVIASIAAQYPPKTGT